MHSELARRSANTRQRGAADAVLRGWLLLACLGLAGSARPVDAKKVKGSPSNAAIEQLFDGVQPAIRECALTHGIYKGATVVELEATVMVARDGRVFSAQVTAKLAPKTPAQAPESLQSCVGDALRKMKFPASGDTFRKLLRNWKFASA